MELGVTPEEGAVIRYSFLWSHEYKAGRSEGSKDRACVVVMSSDTGRVLVTPITSHPGEGSTVIDLPLVIKRRLGLDERRSWVIVSELNKFTWPGFDVRAVPGRTPSTCSYGHILPGFLLQIRSTIGQLARKRLVRPIDRDDGPS